MEGLKQYQALLGKTYSYHINGIQVHVVAVDVRVVWGRTHFKVVPQEGTGSTWVDSESLITL